MKILVIDGQGGGIGAKLISSLKNIVSSDDEIIAVGTNAYATAAMLKAGADAGATGENPVIYNSSKADIITGPIGIAFANSMYGEITSAMANAVTSSDAAVVLVPVSKCKISIAGLESNTPDNYVKEAISVIKSAMEDIRGARD